MADIPLSSAELDALMSAQTALPPPVSPEDDQFPPPPPEVVEAAKAILRNGIESTLEVDGKVILGKPSAPTISEEDKVYFVRHITHCQAFKKSYTYLGGAVVVTAFSPVQGLEDEVLNEVIKEEGVIPTATRETREARLRIARAIYNCTYETTLSVVKPPMKNYRDRLAELTSGMLSILLDAHAQFDKLYNDLLSKVDDPSFWPTPSYGT